MLKLRDYQLDMVARTRESLKQHQATILQAPTGAGKTAIATHMMANARDMGKRTFFMVHQNELLKQTSKALWRNKLEHGLIASGKASNPLPVQLASVMTLKNRLDRYEAPDLIIIDEAHRSLAPTYVEIAKTYPNAKIVGLTATPRRTDGKGLGHLYQDIVTAPPIRYFIDEGFLCDYELYGIPVDADLSEVSSKLGDFDSKQLSTAMNKPTITGDAVEHYRKFAFGKPCVVMCVDIAHAESVADEYNRQGIKAQTIHGNSANRDAILDNFEKGEFQVLTSVNLMIEGVDLPFIECVQWLRPTQSLVIYMQGNGRGLRPFDTKSHLIILDHVGNYKRHGLPDSHRDWDLFDRKRSAREKAKDPDEDDIGIQTCKQCYLTFLSGVSLCPHCGAPVELKERKLQVVDGELERIKAAAIAEEKRRARQEQGQSKTLEELVGLGLRNKYKNAAAWAANILASRENRKPAQNDYLEAKRIELRLRSV